MSIIFYPLCMSFKEFGTLGVVMAMCMVNISGLIVNIIQFNKVISGRATGIWKCPLSFIRCVCRLKNLVLLVWLWQCVW